MTVRAVDRDPVALTLTIAVVTPSDTEGDRVGSQVICAS